MNANKLNWTKLGQKGHLLQEKLFLMVKDILSLEDTNICNQHDSSITNFYPDFKFYSPSYINVNSPLKWFQKDKVYH